MKHSDAVETLRLIKLYDYSGSAYEIIDRLDFIGALYNWTKIRRKYSLTDTITLIAEKTLGEFWISLECIYFKDEQDAILFTLSS